MFLKFYYCILLSSCLGYAVQDKISHTISFKLDDLGSKVSELEEDVNQKLDAFGKKENALEGKINNKLDALGKKDLELEENIIHELESLVKKETVEKNINRKLVASYKMNHALENISNRFIITISPNKESDNEINGIHQEMLCKKWVEPDSFYPKFYSLNSRTFTNVQLTLSKKGSVEYFEMQIALKAKSGYIMLSSVSNPKPEDLLYEIFYESRGGNLHIKLRRSRRETLTKTILSDITSSTYFNTFYIKISEGKLEFGRPFETLPIISYYDAERLELIKYVSFSNWGSDVETLYDCPAEKMLCKEWVDSESYYPTFYSIDNATFNHVSLNRSDTGGIEHFEMNIAVKNKRGYILLSSVPNPGPEDILYEILFKDLGGDRLHTKIRRSRQKTLLEMVENVSHVSTSFHTYKIKIYNEVLEFGRQCQNWPTSIRDQPIGLIKYIGFSNWGSNENFLYDCPATISCLSNLN